jgi:hypothetical protein
MLTTKVNNLNNFKFELPNVDPVKVDSIVDKQYTKDVSGIHHKELSVGIFSATGMVGGCGVMHMWDINNLAYNKINNIKNDFEEFKEALKTKMSGYPCGTLIARLGIRKGGGKYISIYGDSEEKLLSLGFTIVSTYRNEAHPLSKEDYQRLYIYTFSHD